jgi:hypothetical protein
MITSSQTETICVDKWVSDYIWVGGSWLPLVAGAKQGLAVLASYLVTTFGLVVPYELFLTSLQKIKARIPILSTSWSHLLIVLLLELTAVNSCIKIELSDKAGSNPNWSDSGTYFITFPVVQVFYPSWHILLLEQLPRPHLPILWTMFSNILMSPVTSALAAKGIEATFGLFTLTDNPSVPYYDIHWCTVLVPEYDIHLWKVIKLRFISAVCCDKKGLNGILGPWNK